MMKFAAASILLINALSIGFVHAAPRDGGGNAKIVAKLQAMLRDITSERDALKTERDAIKSDLEKLTAGIDKLKQEKASAASVESRLSGEISVQKSNNDEIKGRLEKTNAKLLEVIDKYNALNKDKNDLGVEHGNLQNTQKLTAAELTTCENKNVRLFEAAKEIVDNYQKRGILDALLESEPVFQINSVETETILQEYQDKLNKQKYQKTSKTDESQKKLQAETVH
jgi:septum formation topological specificity factor MinE